MSSYYCTYLFPLAVSLGVTIGFLPVLYTVQEEDGFATVSATVLQGTLARAVLVEFDTTTGTASKQYKIHLGF